MNLRTQVLKNYKVSLTAFLNSIAVFSPKIKESHFPHGERPVDVLLLCK